MIISNRLESKPSEVDLKVNDGDILDITKFAKLPHPLIAKLYGGDELMVETICVQTGCIRYDVWGKIQLGHFGDVKAIIDINGGEHDPDEFWIDYN